ncbi:MAG: hypothetical protein O2877_01060, partial [bacterium]|nr:hypothetical protein [bacterium]
MTKYILHGGRTSRKHPGNDAFFREMVKGFVGSINVLIVYFAIDSKKQESCYAEDMGFFTNAIQGVRLDLVLATEEKFIEQIK